MTSSAQASFASLGLNAALVASANTLGLHNPTSVQVQAMPHVLQGTDVMAQAQTGSGKTLAYVLPLLQHLSQPKQHQ